MFAPARILYVEDDKDSFEIISLMLSLANERYEVVRAMTAEEALKMIEKQSFDLYILDSRLPEMSGVELCRRIRKKHKKTPILFYSGMVRFSDKEAALNAGANAYLIKPQGLDLLEETVERLLSDSSVKN